MTATQSNEARLAFEAAITQLQSSLATLVSGEAALAALLVAAPPPPPLPPPPAKESASGTTLTAPRTSISDANDVAWTLVASASKGNQIAKHRVVDTITGNVSELAHVSRVIWQQAFGLWWSWDGTAWTPSAVTARSPLVTPTPAPAAGSGNILVGIYMDPPDSPTWSSFMGYKPHYTINNSYSGPGGGGSNPCSALSNNGNGGYPTVVGNSTYDANSGMGDPDAAASGAYNATYANTFATVYGPCAATIYALRLNWEWPGYWFDFSPSWNGSGSAAPQSQWVPPATWIAGWRNFVTTLRANPATAHIKVSWDYPTLQYGGAAALAYYPGDAYVDIISGDHYFNTQYDGPTSAGAWAKATGKNGLNDMAAFAAAHNKPMAFWEWGDAYTDGYCVTQFSNWMKAHNVVAHSYWDSNTGVATKLQGNGTRQAAYVAAWQNWKYAGTYWGTTSIPIPITTPAGY
jgi:hypothetical protein